MHYRAIFISDLHLGSKASKTGLLLDFLKNNTSDELYLIGDIVDIYALSSRWFWPSDHNTVVQKILRLSRKGTKVFYILGNHDHFFRSWVEETGSLSFGNIIISDRQIHTTLHRKKFLVVHGDQFDGAIRSMPCLYWLGDKAYSLALSLNHYYNIARNIFGYPYWSLSAYLKNKVKKAVQHISDFEILISKEIQKFGVDGIICGHVHSPAHKMIEGFEYINDGDWQENCTAAVETQEGELQILNWPPQPPESENNVPGIQSTHGMNLDFVTLQNT